MLILVKNDDMLHWILDTDLRNIILMPALSICCCFVFTCLYLNKAVSLSLSIYRMFKEGCLKVNTSSSYHSYQFNEIMTRV